MNEFVVVDVETANPKLSSICQIGIVKFSNHECIEKHNILINPLDYFDPFNVSIHGINEGDIKNSPSFYDYYPLLSDVFKDDIIISHTYFDKTAIRQACDKYGLTAFNNRWIDSARMARSTWDFCQKSGYGLKNLCEKFNIPLVHHDACSDAYAAGLIVQEALAHTGMTINDFIEKSNLKSTEKHQNLSPNSEGVLFGERIAFTGACHLPRRDLEIAAANSGCEIHNTVKNNTTILVVGEVDLSKLAGYSKSSKQRKAEELIAKGNHIKIIGELDFNDLINC
ncbi:transposase [Salmonella enterica subsp. enterica serovar Newport]|nr:transposase [Salmonella enterica subsp. enterica serovar Newport]